MTRDLFRELGWLPMPPRDFDAQVRGLDVQDETFGRRVQWLAGHALDENQLTKLARLANKAARAGTLLPSLTSFSLGVVSNATTDLIRPAIVGTGLRFGLAIECIVGAYDQALQESTDATSAINRARPKAVLVALDWRGLRLHGTGANDEAADALVAGARAYIESIRAGIREHSGAVCIVQNVAPPPERVFGSLEPGVAGSLIAIIDRVNRAIAEDLDGSTDVLLDVAGLAATVGLSHWHSSAQWNLAKLPFSGDFVPLYADHVCRVFASMTGRSRRCLVLDLDNTMWGGVIGDDGLAGILLARGDAIGEAYLELQQYVLALRDRGVVLAVASKNDDAVARTPFREHPDMLIKEDHIAIFQANWNDKATNIAAIARELAFGLGSLVFVDDNPFEREIVRRTLPEVAVVELPEDPAAYARTLSAAGYFELTKLSNEDVNRARFYEGNARRAALQSAVGDVDAYLASLNMEIVFQPFDAVGRARIAQLINKSNQFNLTTRRYTEADVDEMAADPTCLTLQIRLVDAFGDNGMISVIICRGVGSDHWQIDTWLMSCRVLGRRVEQMVLRELLRQATARGASTLEGTYVPTDRNSMVAKHYDGLGFELISTAENGTTKWRLRVSEANVDAAPMRVTRSGLE